MIFKTTEIALHEQDTALFKKDNSNRDASKTERRGDVYAFAC
jgi:hypothetical protein